MTYQSRVKNHLSSYKRDVLNIEEKGVFNHQGKELKYHHILPKKYGKLNILEPYRDSFYDSIYSNITFHKYFHHLNSSQALCINLFYPLIAEGRLDLVLKLLGLQQTEITHAQFEFESELEISNGRKTNFDFYLKGLESLRIYIELKYTEQTFGSAVNDQAHADKYWQTYLPLLQDNRFIKEEFKTKNHFLENYQVMRNLIHMGDSDYVVFLYPEANLTIHEQAKRAYDDILTDEGKVRLKLVSLVKAVEVFADNVSEFMQKEYFKLFSKKYALLQ
ncbi:MAG: hypothetical protein GVY07_14950 [Bacteroidetes bacterium]|jgi:hypothetical protein|nr:hypothetical protein [Bacteroidota bacterium]